MSTTRCAALLRSFKQAPIDRPPDDEISAHGAMRVHGLNVNSRPSTPRGVRQHLRHRVFLLERWAAMQAWDATLERRFIRLSSSIGHLKQLNPGDVCRLQARLKRFAPFRDMYVASRVTSIAACNSDA
jgi:hypothetical protein